MLGLERRLLKLVSTLTVAAALLIACGSESTAAPSPTNLPKNLGVLNLEIQWRISQTQFQQVHAMAALVNVSSLTQLCTVNHVHQDIMTASGTSSGLMIITNIFDHQAKTLLFQDLQRLGWTALENTTTVADNVWCARISPEVIALGKALMVSNQDVKKGQNLHLYNNAGEQKQLIANGSLYENMPEGNYPPGNEAALFLTGISIPGNSGGPIIDLSGNIVAFDSGSSENPGFVFAAPAVNFEGKFPPPILQPIQ